VALLPLAALRSSEHLVGVRAAPRREPAAG
jgi:hypothetical protein